MSIMSNLTEEMLAKDESLRLAFVSSLQDHESVARTVCAMLNSKGGTILVGVKDRASMSKHLSDADVNSLKNLLCEQISPRILFTVTLDSLSGGQVVTVEVPTGADRPYVCNGSVYIRKGAKTIVADAASIRDMVLQQAHKIERWERRISSELKIDDLDSQLLRETVLRAQNRRGYHFADADNQQAVLEILALARHGQLTNAADVLYGQDVALRHPQTRLRAVCYKTDRGDDFIDEQLFEGPAFYLLDKAMDFLKRHVVIASQFPPDQLSRATLSQYPFNSLREGLVNALVHRDFAAFSGSLSLSIYRDRIEIWNSGQLAAGLTWQKLRSPTHESILINPDICYVFFLHELMERVGRGTYKIVQECREMGLPKPRWENTSSGVRLTFYNRQSSIELLKPNKRQAALLDELAVGTTITLSEYMARFAANISDRQARRDLQQLVDAAIMSKVGSGPATAYRLLEKKA
jgi:ATP-dependent DNA helicase RecG